MTPEPAFPAASRAPMRLCDGITLLSPVVQAALGSNDNARLAAAVSEAGALGCLTVHETDPPAFRRELARIRRLTRRPVLLAFTAPFESDSIVEIALEKGFRHIQAFWWNGPRLSRLIRDSGGIVFRQVGSATQGREALDQGADVLVAQGTEAGGPVRTPLALAKLIEDVRGVAPETPLIAGGGLATRDDVENVLKLGANAALLGTRFLLTTEANMPQRDKRRLAAAAAGDLLLDNDAPMDWPCAPCRGLPPQSGVSRKLLFAGQGLGQMHSIESATDIVRSLSPY